MFTESLSACVNAVFTDSVGSSAMSSLVGTFSACEGSFSCFQHCNPLQVFNASEQVRCCCPARVWDTRAHAKLAMSLPLQNAKKLLYAVWAPNGHELLVTSVSNVNTIIDVRKEAVTKALPSDVEVCSKHLPSMSFPCLLFRIRSYPDMHNCHQLAPVPAHPSYLS